MMKYIILGTIIFVLFISASSISAFQSAEAETDTLFVYRLIGENTQEIRWQSLQSPAIQGAINIAFSGNVYVSVAPRGGHLAYVDQDKRIHILDMLNNTEETLSILSSPRVEPIIYDELFYSESFLQWSPDGKTLAFVGLGSAGKPQIYTYQIETKQYIHFTQDINFADRLANISSWSPTSKWLVFAGIPEINDGSLPLSRTYISSADGRSSYLLPAEHQACRLSWSPNEQLLATYNNCYKATGANSVLMIFEFNPDTITTASPIIISENPAEVFVFHSRPYWLDDTTLVALKEMSSYNNSNTSTNIISYTISSREEQNIAIVDTTNGSGISQKDSWLFWQTTENQIVVSGYDLITGMQLQFTPLDQFCSVGNLRVDPIKNYLAYITGCVPDNISDRSNLAIQVASISNGEILLTIPQGTIVGWSIVENH